MMPARLRALGGTGPRMAGGALRALSGKPGPSQSPWMGSNPGGPKPIVYRGMVLNSKANFFYACLFLIPSFGTFLLYCNGKVQLSREELLASPTGQAHLRQRGTQGMEGYDLAREKQEAMNKVLFQKGTIGKPEWAIKRDAEQARIAEEKAAAAKEKAQK